MPWVKLTDDWYDDPKIAALDDGGVALWVIGLTWCARNLTDGHIPARVARKLTDDGDRAVDQLVTARLWSSTEAGFLVENYLEYQPSRDEVLSKRDAERKRSQRRRTPADQRSSGDRAVDRPETGSRPSHPVPVPEAQLLTSQSEIALRHPHAVDERLTYGCVPLLQGARDGGGGRVVSQDANASVPVSMGGGS